MGIDRRKWAEQMVQNAARMRNAGPDTPIDWDTFGYEERPEPVPGFRERLAQMFLGPKVPQAAAQPLTTPQTAGGGMGEYLGELLTNLIATGMEKRPPEYWSRNGKAKKPTQ